MNQTSSLHEGQSPPTSQTPIYIPCKPEEAERYVTQNGLIFEKDSALGAFKSLGREMQFPSELQAFGAEPQKLLTPPDGWRHATKELDEAYCGPYAVWDDSIWKHLTGRPWWNENTHYAIPQTDPKSAVTSLVEDCVGVQAAGSQNSGASNIRSITVRDAFWMAGYEIDHDEQIIAIRGCYDPADAIQLRWFHGFPTSDKGGSWREIGSEAKSYFYGSYINIARTPAVDAAIGMPEDVKAIVLAAYANPGSETLQAAPNSQEETPSQQQKEVSPVSPVSPGEGFRWVELYEVIPAGAEFRRADGWVSSEEVGKLCHIGFFYRIPLTISTDIEQGQK